MGRGFPGIGCQSQRGEEVSTCKVIVIDNSSLNKIGKNESILI